MVECKSYRLLRWLGWEPNRIVRQAGAWRVETWLRPHPNDVADYSTRRALWVAFTGRSRRGGWNAGWRIWSEGR